MTQKDKSFSISILFNKFVSSKLFKIDGKIFIDIDVFIQLKIYVKVNWKTFIFKGQTILSHFIPILLLSIGKNYIEVQFIAFVCVLEVVGAFLLTQLEPLTHRKIKDCWLLWSEYFAHFASHACQLKCLKI